MTNGRSGGIRGLRIYRANTRTLSDQLSWQGSNLARTGKAPGPPDPTFALRPVPEWRSYKYPRCNSGVTARERSMEAQGDGSMESKDK